MARSRVELFEQIRRDRRVESLSIRELADRHHVHRRTVRQALANAIPPPRKAYPRRARPAIDAYVEMIDDWLVKDRDVPRKQRHTARRVWQRLVAEHGATLRGGDGVAVRRAPAGRARAWTGSRWRCRRPIRRARRPRSTSVSSTRRSPGRWMKVWMFVMRLSHSGKAFHVAFATQAQEAFLKGHVTGVRVLRSPPVPAPVPAPFQPHLAGPGWARGRPDGTQRLDLTPDAPPLRRQRPQRPRPPHLRTHHDRHIRSPSAEPAATPATPGSSPQGQPTGQLRRHILQSAASGCARTRHGPAGT